MIQQDIITGPHRWKKGQSGNSAGRPLGARQRISEKLLADLAMVWEEHRGVATPGDRRPWQAPQIAFGLLPLYAYTGARERSLRRVNT
jgi:hypothetical protein